MAEQNRDQLRPGVHWCACPSPKPVRVAYESIDGRPILCSGCKGVPGEMLAGPDSRNDRQRIVAKWCAAAFGTDQASSLQQRALRLLEECLEAYQAAGAPPEVAHRLVDFVFSRPAGPLHQELGGIGVTVLALANAAGLSADAEEAREVARVLAKPLSHFTARNEAKNAAGFLVAPAGGTEGA